MRWLKRARAVVKSRRAEPPPIDHLDAAIAEQQARYERLRESLAALLYLREKLRAEQGPRAPRLPQLRRKLRCVGSEMASCQSELQSLRECRLDTTVEVAFMRAV